MSEVGEIISIRDVLKAKLWADSEVCYRVESHAFLNRKTLLLKLRRTLPYPHGCDDVYAFGTIEGILEEGHDPMDSLIDLGGVFQTTKPEGDEQ